LDYLTVTGTSEFVKFLHPGREIHFQLWCHLLR